MGNLPLDAREGEIEDVFASCGTIARVKVKTPARPPAYAFVTYERASDAREAARTLDGGAFDGGRLRVELARGERGRDDGDGDGDGNRRGRDEEFDRYAGRMRSDRPYERGRGDGFGRMGGRGMTRKSDHQVKVEDVPRGTSWRDVKDEFRRAGCVTYAQTFTDGSGRRCAEVHFDAEDEADRAVDMFDDRRFENASGASA